MDENAAAEKMDEELIKAKAFLTQKTNENELSL